VKALSNLKVRGNDPAHVIAVLQEPQSVPENLL
jgi:hypothetical protein